VSIETTPSSSSSGAPEIKVQPSDYSINLNAKATFAVVATGMKPLHYQWFHNGQVIEGNENLKWPYLI
jgi:hypothetical protein